MTYTSNKIVISLTFLSMYNPKHEFPQHLKYLNILIYFKIKIEF